MDIKLDKTCIRLIHDDGSIYLEKGLLVEGAGLCAIYNDGHFEFVCSADYELGHILDAHRLNLEYLEEERLCSECGKPMKSGFYFESSNTYYCSEECLMKDLSWADYLEIYDDGNGEAYWTYWEE